MYLTNNYFANAIMKEITTAFQYVVRYNTILNFSQVSRKLISPFAAIASNIRIEKQNSADEIVHLLFQDDNVIIIVTWDKIVFRGQGDLSKYTVSNSMIETLFFSLLDKISALDSFSGIKNVVFAANSVREYENSKDEISVNFAKNFLNENINSIVKKPTDIAIIIEEFEDDESYKIIFGPYFGSQELERRNLKPLYIAELGDLEFIGLIIEYSCQLDVKKVSFKNFVSMVEIQNQKIKQLWKSF